MFRIIDEEDEDHPERVELDPIDVKEYNVKYEGSKMAIFRDGLEIAAGVLGVAERLAVIVRSFLPYWIFRIAINKFSEYIERLERQKRMEILPK